MPQVVGLSVSWCIKDIAEGGVAYEDVEFIVGGIRAPDARALGRVLDKYRERYWYHDIANACEDIFHHLLRDKKLFQPRLVSNFLAPRVYAGHWVDFWDLDIVLAEGPHTQED